MQVCALMSAHIVWFAWVHKEIGLSACTNASFQETECVLWHHYRVVKTNDNLQFALQVLGFCK